MPKTSSVRNALDFHFPQTPGVEPVEGSLFLVDIGMVKPTSGQPRTVFPAEARAEMAANIRELRERGAGVGGSGILQPLLVRADPEGGYLITAGERRYWAATDAGLAQVPVLIREQSESEAFEEALIENIQRHDLSDSELARAYQRLIKEHGLSMREVARRVGKSASEISRTVAVADNPLLAGAVERGDISISQAQEMLPVPEARQEDLVALVAERRRSERAMSLPELRKLVKKAKSGGVIVEPPEEAAEEDVALRNTSGGGGETADGVALRNTSSKVGTNGKRASKGGAQPVEGEDAPPQDGAENASFLLKLRRVTAQLRELRDTATAQEDWAFILDELNEQQAAVEAIRAAVRSQSPVTPSRHSEEC